jgi:hypothetical protein
VIHDGRPRVGLLVVLNMHGIPRGEALGTSQGGPLSPPPTLHAFAPPGGLRVAAARGLRSADPSWICLSHNAYNNVNVLRVMDGSTGPDRPIFPSHYGDK